jgi:DNA-binding MarR family transcriptional regulator
VAATDLTDEDYRALAEFRYQIRRFLHFSESAARSAGLNPQHHQLLLALKGIPDGTPPTVNEIAARLHIRHHSAVELTNRLTLRGLIRKKQDRVDRRRVLLDITPRGNAVLRKLSLIHRAQLESVGKDLIHALRKLVNHNEGPHEKARSRKDNHKRTR